MEIDVINIDPEVLSRTPVFLGTRVPVETLFDHLESGISFDDFLSDFPTVTHGQAVRVLELAGKVVSSANFKKLYETAS
jgi:uncharacterized protein (DUF433 family)